MSLISNLLYNYPKHKRVLAAGLHLYEVQEQAKLMIIETGNTHQSASGSRVGMTVKEHKRTFGGEENVLYFDSYITHVLSNAFVKTLQTIHLGSVHSNVCKLILSF